MGVQWGHPALNSERSERLVLHNKNRETGEVEMKENWFVHEV